MAVVWDALFCPLSLHSRSVPFLAFYLLAGWSKQSFGICMHLCIFIYENEQRKRFSIFIYLFIFFESEAYFIMRLRGLAVMDWNCVYF